MNKYATLLISIALTALAACSSPYPLPDNHYTSWDAFCDARGYDRDTNSDFAVNEYLDTWRGSVDEDEALARAGVECF